jgi:hypothetical protein
MMLSAFSASANRCADFSLWMSASVNVSAGLFSASRMSRYNSAIVSFSNDKPLSATAEAAEGPALLSR